MKHFSLNTNARIILLLLENTVLYLFIKVSEIYMALGKQAKVINEKQVRVVLSHLTTTRDPIRNKVQFLLSCDAGLRAKEVASVEWRMLLDAEGDLTDAIRLEDKSAKGKSGGVVYISTRLKEALADLLAISSPIGTILKTKSGKRFWLLYRDLGFEGCSSHSGRRTAITKWARTISQHGWFYA